MPLARPREIPSQETILAVSKFDVLDENGRAVTFGSLFEKQKTLAVFIRTLHSRDDFASSLRMLPTGHFWCAVSALLHNSLFDRSHRHLIAMSGGFTSRARSWVFLMAGNAQLYVMQLASIPRKALDNANVRLVVIGCGSWDVIPSYRGEKLIGDAMTLSN